MKTIFSLVLSGASLALGLAPTAASQPPEDPIQLEWRRYEGQSWVGGIPDAPFLYLRARGEAQYFAGTWVELTGRVWFHPEFFTEAPYNTKKYDNLRSLPRWNLDTAETPYNMPMPSVCVEQARYDAIIAKNEGTTGGAPRVPDLVREFSQPLLQVPVGVTDSERIWSTNYFAWNAGTTTYWTNLRAHDYLDPALFSRDALIKQLILDQAPELDTGFFTSDGWERALTLGVYFAFQGVTMIDGNLNPANVPTAETGGNQAPGLGTWTAKGTTTALPTGLFGHTDPGLPYPAEMPGPVGPVFVASGADVVIHMSGLTKDTFAKLSINGVPTTTVPLSAGATVRDAVFTMLPFLARGTVVAVTGFVFPGGHTDLPSTHYYTFLITQ